LGEFYCFTGIISGYLSDDRELNPLNGKSLSDEDFRRIRMSSHDVKRKKPFLGVRQYVDEDDYEEQADRFIEYHEEIVDEDQSESVPHKASSASCFCGLSSVSKRLY